MNATVAGALVAALGTLLGGIYAAWAARKAKDNETRVNSLQIEAEVFARARAHYDDILARQADEIAYLGREVLRIRALLEQEQGVSDDLRMKVRRLTEHVVDRPDPMQELRENPLAPQWPPRANGL